MPLNEQTVSSTESVQKLAILEKTITQLTNLDIENVFKAQKTCNEENQIKSLVSDRKSGKFQSVISSHVQVYTN